MSRIGLLLGACLVAAGTAHAATLRVCADPNNLPFSNRAGQGFENKIVELMAKQLGETVSYTWWAQRRGFVRNTLKAGKCDVWPGVATGYSLVLTTRPYYRSSYVFVTRADRRLDITSYDDPRLRQLTIGVEMVGNDAMNTPPTHALARRGLIGNVRGYMLYGNYKDPNPPAEIIKAVADRKIDVAIVWGPLAGYFAGKESATLRLAPVHPSPDGAGWPMAFDISMGVRKGDKAFQQEINRELVRDRAAIEAILTEYDVPLLPLPAPAQDSAERSPPQ